MNKYRKEYCEENGRVKINPENTKLYDYIKHLENKLEQAEQLALTDVSSMLVANGMPAFGTKEFNDMCNNFFGGKPKSN